MTTYIHPDNPFFGGMEQVIMGFFIVTLIGAILFLAMVALIIKYILIAIFGNHKEEEHTSNNIIEAEEASDFEVVDNGAQSINDEKESDG